MPRSELLKRLAAGDPEAADALYKAYAPYLRAIVRRRLSDRFRPEFDSVDIVQSVWVQVVRRLNRDGWEIGNEPELRALLATIARRRLVSRVRHHSLTTDRRITGAELDQVAVNRRETPSELVQAEDVWSKMMALCPPEHRELLWLRRSGLKLDEIAARTGLHEGSVRRILRRLSRKLLGSAQGDDPLETPTRRCSDSDADGSLDGILDDADTPFDEHSPA